MGSSPIILVERGGLSRREQLRLSGPFKRSYQRFCHLQPWNLLQDQVLLPPNHWDCPLCRGSPPSPPQHSTSPNGTQQPPEIRRSRSKATTKITEKFRGIFKFEIWHLPPDICKLNMKTDDEKVQTSDMLEYLAETFQVWWRITSSYYTSGGHVNLTNLGHLCCPKHSQGVKDSQYQRWGWSEVTPERVCTITLTLLQVC